MKCSLTIVFEENATAESMAASLRMQAGLLEGMSAKEAASRKNTDAAPADAGDDEDDDFGAAAATPAKGKGKKAAAVEVDDDDDAPADAGDDDEDDDFGGKPAAAKGKAKVKKVSLDEALDACKAKAKKTDRATVLKLLNKHFGTKSVTDIDAAKYGDVVRIMTGKA